MTLKLRLLLGFGMCALVALLMSAFTVFAASRLNQFTTGIAEERLPQVQAVKDMQINLLDISGRTQDHVMATDEDQRHAIADRIAGAQARFDSVRKNFGEHDTAGERKDELAQLDVLAAQLADGEKIVLSLSDQGNSTAAMARLATRFTPPRKQMFELLNKMVAEEVAGAQAAADAAGAAYHRLVQVTISVSVALLLLAAIVAVTTTRGVLKQLGGDPSYAFEAVAAIAAGKLTVEVRTAPGDESSLLYAVKGMARSLAGTVAAVKQSAESIHVASEEVAAGNVDLSRRTEQNADQLARAAGSLGALTIAVRQTSDEASAASNLAMTATETAGRGNQAVARIVETMGRISNSSVRISDITQVIDGLAFQTNILALNAAVEAARAGDQGRSFAVVASEVRTLAQRCAGAAREIKALIAESTGHVEAGSKLVDDAGKAMADIVASIDSFNGLIRRIHDSAGNQSRGIVDINQRVANLDDATKGNSARVEQSAAAAESLRSQAEKLAGAVATFDIA